MCKNTFILLLIPIFILVSCSNDNQGFAIGSEIIPSNTDVVVLDTFSLQSYTVKVDSIATSGFTKALVGLYQPTNANEDVYLGTDTVSAYFEVTPPNPLPNLINYVNGAGSPIVYSIYDSVALIYRYSKYFYGDTTLPFTFVLHEIPHPLNWHLNNNGLYYNKSLVSAGDQNAPILGSKTFLSRPLTNQVYNDQFMKLNDQFGLNLFNLVNDQDPSMTNPTFFNDKFGAFLLTPGNQPGPVIGFNESDSSLTIRIFYHSNVPLSNNIAPGNSSVAKFLDFKITTNANLQFGRFIPNLPAPINSLQYPFSKVSTNLTGGLSYVQGPTGFRTRLEFPTLFNILNVSQNIKLLNATLYVVPQRQSFQYFTLPTALSVYLTDDSNDLLLQYTTNNGQAPNYKLNRTNNSLVPDYYAFDVTAFVASILTLTGGVSNNQIPALLITPAYEGTTSASSYSTTYGSSTLNRVVIDNNKYGTNSNSVTSTGLTLTFWRY